MPSENTTIKMRLTKIGSCEIENNLSSISVEHLDKTNLKINYNVFVEINFIPSVSKSCFELP